MKIKQIFLAPVRVLEHNSEHVIKIHVCGEEIDACSRCLGLYISGFVCYFVFAYIFLYTNIKLPFFVVITTSFVLGSVTLIDWVSVDYLRIRKSSNKVRFFAGVLLGVAGTFYFWLLPESWFFKLSTLILYNLIAILLVFVSMRRNKRAAQINSSTGK